MATTEVRGALSSALATIHTMVSTGAGPQRVEFNAAEEEIKKAFESLRDIGNSDWTVIKAIRKAFKINTTEESAPSHIAGLKALFCGDEIKVESGRRKREAFIDDLCREFYHLRKSPLAETTSASGSAEETEEETRLLAGFHDGNDDESAPAVVRIFVDPLADGSTPDLQCFQKEATAESVPQELAVAAGEPTYAELLAKRITDKPVEAKHLEAIVNKSRQIQQIGERFLGKYATPLLNNLIEAFNELMTSPSKRNELSSLFVSWLPIAPADPLARKEFEAVNARFIPPLINTHLLLLKTYLEQPTLGPAMLNELAGWITPQCFGKPKQNIALQKLATAQSFLALSDFLKHFKEALSTVEHGFENGDAVAAAVYMRYIAHFKLEREIPSCPADSKRKDKTLPGASGSTLRSPHIDELNADLRAVIGELTSANLAPSEIPTEARKLAEIIPHLSELMISKILKPHVLYTIVLRFYEMFLASIDAPPDPDQTLCRDPTLSEVAPRVSEKHFIEATGEILFELVKNYLGAAGHDVVGLVVKCVGPLFKGKLQEAAAKIEEQINQMGTSVCLFFLPINLVNQLYFDAVDGNTVASPDMEALLKDDPTPQRMAELASKIKESVDLEALICNQIDQNFNIVIGAPLKGGVKLVDINTKIAAVAYHLAHNEKLKILMILYVLRTISPLFQEAKNG